MSFGRSTWTGPGRPVEAMWKASRMIGPRSLPSFTRKLCFVHERVMPTLSASWKASLPMRCVGTCPVKATIGMESIMASCSAVTRFVHAGPEVTRHTPTRPVARA
jgi:hypothetical protein